MTGRTRLSWRWGGADTALIALARRRLTAPGVTLTVEGASMAPLLRPGDRLQLRAEPPRVGAVVVYRAGSALVVHRVVALRNERGRTAPLLLTKGDRSHRLDPPVWPAQVWGTVCAVQSRRGTLPLEGRAAWVIGRWVALLSLEEARLCRRRGPVARVLRRLPRAGIAWAILAQRALSFGRLSPACMSSGTEGEC